jgi:hypothetical protein
MRRGWSHVIRMMDALAQQYEGLSELQKRGSFPSAIIKCCIHAFAVDVLEEEERVPLPSDGRYIAYYRRVLVGAARAGASSATMQVLGECGLRVFGEQAWHRNRAQKRPRRRSLPWNFVIAHV